LQHQKHMVLVSHWVGDEPSSTLVIEVNLGTLHAKADTVLLVSEHP